jgi:hypothetical protein
LQPGATAAGFFLVFMLRGYRYGSLFVKVVVLS